jgi:hypothetical protein
VAKVKTNQEMVKEIRKMIARYFATCFNNAEMFDLPNDPELVVEEEQIT